MFQSKKKHTTVVEPKLTDAKGLDIPTLLHEKQKKASTIKKTQPKRNRSTFENQKDSHILNSDDRLKNLADYLNNKKLKKTDKETKKNGQAKIRVDSRNNKLKSNSFDVYPYYYREER